MFWYSAAVRSRPELSTSISRSSHFVENSRSCGGITDSTSSTVAPSCVAARTFLRISRALSSGQSWMMFFSTYRSPPSGTASKKEPSAMATRSAMWCLRSSGSASATTCGRSKRTPLELGVAAKMPASSRAVPARDIHNGVIAGEVVGGRHGSHRQLREVRHGVVEDFAEFGLARDIFEALLAAELRNHRLTGPDRLDQVAPVFTVLCRADKPCKGRHRIRRVPTEGLRQRCQAVAAVAALTEDASADQCPQQTAQRSGFAPTSRANS